MASVEDLLVDILSELRGVREDIKILGLSLRGEVPSDGPIPKQFGADLSNIEYQLKELKKAIR